MVVGNRRPCPECSSEIDLADIICPWCGHAVPPPARNPFVPGSFGVTARPLRSGRRVTLGIFLGNVAGLLQILFGQWAFHHSHGVGNVYITANFFVVPFIAGLIGGFFWRQNQPTAQNLAGYSLTSAVMVLIVWLVSGLLLPGQIALLPLTLAFAVFFSLPLIAVIFFVVWLGSLIGNRLFRLPEP
jgi:hypothetical protein